MMKLPLVLAFMCAISALTGCEKQPAIPAPAATSAADRGDVHVLVSADRTTIETSETLLLTISVSSPTDAVIEEPDIAGSIEPFRIESVVAHDPLLVGATTKSRTWSYTLVPFLPGDIAIGPFDIKVTPVAGETVIASAPAIDVRVNSVLGLAADSEFSLDGFDITNYIEEPAPDTVEKSASLIPIAIAVVSLVGIAGGAYFISRRYRQPTEMERRRVVCETIESRARSLTHSIHTITSNGCDAADEIARMVRELLELAGDTDEGRPTRARLEDVYAQLDRIRFGDEHASVEMLDGALHTVHDSAGTLKRVSVATPALPSIGGIVR